MSSLARCAFYRIESRERDGYSRLSPCMGIGAYICYAGLCQHRAIHVSCQLRCQLLPACYRSVVIGCFVLHWEKSCKLFCHLNALARFLVSPDKHFICTFTRRVSKSTPSCVSQWMRRILFECQLWVYVAASCRGFDTLRAQTRSSRMRPARPWLYRIWESTRFRTASCFYRSRIYKHPARQHTVDHVFF